MLLHAEGLLPADGDQRLGRRPSVLATAVYCVDQPRDFPGDAEEQPHNPFHVVPAHTRAAFHCHHLGLSACTRRRPSSPGPGGSSRREPGRQSGPGSDRLPSASGLKTLSFDKSATSTLQSKLSANGGPPGDDRCDPRHIFASRRRGGVPGGGLTAWSRHPGQLGRYRSARRAASAPKRCARGCGRRWLGRRRRLP